MTTNQKCQISYLIAALFATIALFIHPYAALPTAFVMFVVVYRGLTK